MDEQTVAELLCAEVLTRFPEISDRFEDYEGLPYIYMNELAAWIGGQYYEYLKGELIDRIMKFAAWCEAQPRGEDASTDILTIYFVGFYEKLFQYDSGRRLLPKLVSKRDLIANADYLKHWVDEINYDLALEVFDKLPEPSKMVQPHRPKRGKLRGKKRKSH